MQKLIQHLRDENLSIRGFAARSGLSPSFLSEITAAEPEKRKSPSLQTALRIQKATGGKVSVSDWPKLAEIAKAVHEEKRGHDPASVQGAVRENADRGAA